MTRRNSFSAMTNSGMRDAGGFDNDVEFSAVDDLIRVVGDEGRAAFQCIIHRLRIPTLRFPACCVKTRLHCTQIEVREASQVHSSCGADLRQVHGAEFTGADQPDPDRSILLSPGSEHVIKVHRRVCLCGL